MNDDQIEELRARVEARKRAQACADLKRSLAGKDIPVDANALYFTVTDIAKECGITTFMVKQDIRKGKLLARKTKGTRTCGAMWAIHPSDAEPYIAIHQADGQIKFRE